jgi:hypothetical protein
MISFKTNWKNGIATLSQIKLFVWKQYSKEKCLQYLELLEKFEVAYRLRREAQVFIMLKFEVGFQLQSDDVVFLIPTLLQGKKESDGKERRERRESGKERNLFF